MFTGHRHLFQCVQSTLYIGICVFASRNIKKYKYLVIRYHVSSYNYNGNPLTFYEAVYVQFTLKWTVNAQFTL